jgi:fused signal recognition particle receptor
MVFNWFRRKFDDENQAEQTPGEQQVEAKAAETKPEETPAPPQVGSGEVSTPQSQDLLNWAKAAYVNIQKQQVEAAQPETSETSEPEIIPPVETESIPEPEPILESVVEPALAPEAIAKVTEVATDIPVETQAEIQPEIVAEPPTEISREISAEPSIKIPVEVAREASLEAESAAIAPEEVTEAIAQTVEAVIAVEPSPEIQQEQTETAVEIITESEPIPEPEIIAEFSPEPEPIPEQIAEPIPEPVTDPVVTEQPVVEPTPAPVEEPAPAAETNEEPSAPLPFWMQSESDRLARIAALEATAIVEPERPIPQFAPVIQPVVPVRYEPQLPFDESFIWSSEVLAAQGRRPEDISVEEITWLKRLRQGLDKTRLTLVNQLKALVGQGPLNADDVDAIEALLLQADVGVQATDKIVQALQAKLRDEVLPPEAAIAFLKQILREMLDAPLFVQQKGNKKAVSNLVPEKNQLNIWLITGVNGAGKTTTIGKLAHTAKKSGYKTLIAAADTFRAAAVQQVQAWGDRSQVEVIANTGKNTDPAAVVFDAITAAQARGSELLLIDTAGRLQNKNNLMEELSKIRRIVDKKAPDAVIESLLVLDSTLGQNGLRQAEVFSKSAGISGVVLTKLDGTAKGGVAIAVVQQLGLPIRFIGAGEGIEDLRPFSSYEFVEALLSN